MVVLAKRRSLKCDLPFGRGPKEEALERRFVAEGNGRAFRVEGRVTHRELRQSRLCLN